MKILMLTDYFYPRFWGGVEKVTYEVSKRLAKMGNEIVILALNTEKVSALEDLEGLRILRCSSIDLSSVLHAQLTLSTSVFFKILKICKIVNPDIVHVNDLHFFTTMCAVSLKRFIRKPIVTTLHSGSLFFPAKSNVALPLRQIISLYEKTVGRWIVKSSDRIIVVSNAVRDHALILGAPIEKVTTIPNGVDFPLNAPARAKKRDPRRVKRIVFVGRLFFNMGIHTLIEAAPMILAKMPDVCFEVVGDGPLKPYLEALAKRLGVMHAFKFLGVVSNVQGLLAECDIFVRPSLTEGMSLTILEAMASGLPIVATEVGGTPEIIIHNKTGLLIQVNNPKQLANAIFQLLEDSQLSERLGRNAYLFAKEHYSWDKTTELVMSVYNEVVSERQNNIKASARNCRVKGCC